MRNIKPRYNYYLNDEPFGNHPRVIMEILNVPHDRSHRAFHRYIHPHTDLISSYWADWDIDLPEGKLVRILRNEEEVLKSCLLYTSPSPRDS